MDFEPDAPVIYRRNNFYFWMVIIGTVFTVIGIIPTFIGICNKSNHGMLLYSIFSLLAGYIWTLKILIDKPFLLRGNLWIKCLIHPISGVCELVLYQLTEMGYDTYYAAWVHLYSGIFCFVVYILQVNWKAFKPYRIGRPAIMYVHPARNVSYMGSVSADSMPPPYVRTSEPMAFIAPTTAPIKN